MMETIFDHNLTEKELKRFGLWQVPPEYTEIVKKHKCNDSRLYRLGLLYAMRKDLIEANEYWAQIKDRRLLSTLVQDF